MEFELKGQEYRAVKLDVFDQFRVARKLLPAVAGVFDELKSGEITLAALLPQVADAVAAMSDADCDAILHPCLSAVARKNGKIWTAVFQDGVMMFDDIDMLGMLELVGNVIRDSLGDFFPVPLASEIADLPAV
ncbi:MULTISPECIES: phage tail assembly chaperone [unclassified Serratia (in: enterobacteria)]|uniref:phage tail assembly chaperone n=1 Tax=unclassified Serratia (in: enterobacteria) TaxID=2647522 RepID=UPI0005046856|nr:MULTISPECIES: hypothetical protein [unclassified Serratia (in: enterobacteria)]KFK93467.1 bacteriophage protein [Serratia sp. Ag2]KFK97111.1 bacteriophage protein [Serratia sp. Ag1]